MRRLSFLVAALLSLAVIFNGCKKDVETSAVSIDMSKKATLIVYAYAELDYTKDGLEKVPDGTQVTLKINYDSFNPAAEGYWIEHYEIQGGKLEATIPVTDKGVTVEIHPLEFNYNQVQAYGQSTPTIQKLFKCPAMPFNEGGVQTGDIRTHEVTYTAAPYEDFTEVVKRSFKLIAHLDDDKTEFNEVPNATTVTFYTEGWKKEVTVDNHYGHITEIELPKGADVTISFETLKRAYLPGATSTTLVKYLYKTQVGPYNITSPVREEVNCGFGQIWQ